MTVTAWQTFNAKMEEVKSAVLVWGEDIETSVSRGKSLIFVVKTGTGKTHLGKAIVMGILRKGFVAKIVDCSLLLSEIYETYGKDDAGRAKGEAAKLIRAYIDLDVLVINEIGRGPISSRGAGPAYQALINHCELLTNAGWIKAGLSAARQKPTNPRNSSCRSLPRAKTAAVRCPFPTARTAPVQ